MKKDSIYFYPSELKKPKCYHCGSQKVISDWVGGNEFSKLSGERWWYRKYGCPKCNRIEESVISGYTSDKPKMDKMLNRKLYGYKLNLTNMGIIKNTIKIIVVLIAIFIVANVFWWLFGGMISKIHFSPLVINKEVKVPVETIKEVPKEVIKDCDVACAIKILATSENNHWITYAIDNGWSCEKKALKQINCGNLPYPQPRISCEADFQ